MTLCMKLLFQKIRASLYKDVRLIASETCHFLGLEVNKPAMEVIAELVYKKLSVYGTDLEAFAKHAKRTTINSDDVKLLVRRNPSMLAHLNSIVPATSTTGPKRRKTVGKAQETPAKNKDDLHKNIQDNNKEIEEKDEEVVLENTKNLQYKGDLENNFLENMIVDEIDLTFD